MAFILTKIRTVQWPVIFSVPTDGGNVEEHQCSVKFELVSDTEYQELAEKGDIELLMRVVVGFGEDIQSEDGAPLDCTPENKKTLFKSAAFIRMGLIRAYQDAALGSPSKNSKGPLATTRTVQKSKKRK